MGRPTNSLAYTQLRCSGELSGCQRCLAKKIKCHYPAPSKSSGNTENKGCLPATSHAPPQTKAHSDEPSDSPESSTDDSISVLASFPKVLEGGSSFDFEASTFSPLEDADTLLLTDEFSPSETLEHLSAFATDSQKNKPHDDIIWVEESIDHVFNDSTSTWTSSDAITPTSSSQRQSSDFCYACLAQVMRTHEGVEAAAWAQKKRVRDTNDILQEQKKAMIECNELLDCQKCSRQPAQIMLLLSICGKILGTLEAVYYGLSARTDADQVPSPYQTHLKRRWAGIDGVLEPDGPLYQRPMYSIDGKKGQLDDEDRLLVTKSLLMARVKILDGLLSRLRIVITTYSWPAQQSLTQDLQHRLIKGLLVVMGGT